jgi:lambda family phage minor tail protein L
VGGQSYRWTDDANEIGGAVVWQGQAYPRLPIEASGFEVNGQGKSARPTLIMSNIGQVVGAIVRASDDLIGAEVIRHRTYAKYLDAANFANGNPQADPEEEILDRYFVDRKSQENRLTVELELAAATDLEGVQLPAATVNADVCGWVDVADCPHVNSCNHSLKACREKWGKGSTLPFGGFPGVGLRRG